MKSPLALIPKAEDEVPPAPDVTGMLETARALCNRLQGETHRAVRQAVILTLIVNPTQNAIHAMLRQPGQEDAPLRAQLLAILSLVPEALEPIMENFLADENHMVRQFALNMFSEISGSGDDDGHRCGRGRTRDVGPGR